MFRQIRLQFSELADRLRIWIADILTALGWHSAPAERASAPVPPPGGDAQPAANITLPEPELPASNGRRVKWRKPKGTELLRAPAKRRTETENIQRPKRERAPRPEVIADSDPEQWGRFYFRDAILDNLGTYFVYLKRMKATDKDAYDLLSQVGIHVMPASSIRAFDKWRAEAENDKLSKWWLDNRPSFGAIAYGIDETTKDYESVEIVDIPPDHPEWNGRKQRKTDETLEKNTRCNRVLYFGGTGREVGGEKTGMIWVPKFVYFTKYDRPPIEFQKVSDGDVYKMTVYWDRVDGKNRYFSRRKGGSVQEYGVCVDKATGEIRILRCCVSDDIVLRHKRGPKRRSGARETTVLKRRRWQLPVKYLEWSRMHDESGPEDYLRRLFIETALMYEAAGMGSMVRIEAHKEGLVAVFGVEIKRTSYFFKDRDVAVTDNGTRKPIFHVVRPHMRRTRRGERPVRMHFRGLTKFDWAGYKINITVPGRDHAHLPELGMGMIDEGRIKPKDKKKFAKMAVLGQTIREHLAGNSRK